MCFLERDDEQEPTYKRWARIGLVGGLLSLKSVQLPPTLVHNKNHTLNHHALLVLCWLMIKGLGCVSHGSIG